MTDISDLVRLSVALLRGFTDAEDRVFSPGDVPSETYPQWRVRGVREENEGLGPNGAPQFFTLAHVRIVGRVQASADSAEEGGHAAEEKLWRLKRQAEVAIVNAFGVMLQVQEIAHIHAEIGFSSEGRMNFGELVMDVGLRFYRGADQFAQPAATTPTSVLIAGDLVNVADPSGTHTPPFAYPVTPAPRTQGPDGRVEAGAEIPLNQD